ncbi:MAG: single-stranded DNA-binding protein [Synergistes jonesii]|uniref:single-stranded DNA-binding protein n=1 Tax=Synergistes jonesii TaxID=2754 RepID=UPI00248E0065|nr:single-stranded DNA-binding protein [Synergistes jonesii]MDY2984636.1 single-stranded DNA-binding protein [Synergistes jonesii]
MSRDFNRVILMGRLARDPEVRFTPSKQKVARFTLCTGRQWKNKVTGELQSHTDFITVTAWSFTADLLERYVKKGSQILVEGRISTRDYDDVKTGQHKWVTEVVAENIVLLGSPRRDGDQSGSYQQQNYGGQQPYQHQAQQQSDAMPAPDMGSLRNEGGFDDGFPLDFSELGGGTDQSGDVEIPF